MESFAVAAFSPVAGVAVAKLCLVISKLRGQPNTDATFIKNELSSIEAAIRRYAHTGRYEEGVAQLRRLAYDIEDVIDCFNANKLSPEEFAKKIKELRDRSVDTSQRIERYNFPLEGAVRSAQVAAHVPTEVQNLDGTGKMNCLLYLCLFPPHHHVRTKPLIRRWLAEGLVQGEQLAIKNLSIFIQESIINSRSIQRSNNGKVKRCQPTEEVFQYISQRSMSENFILVCNGAVELKTEAARRLSVHPSANGELILPEDLSCLRTLAVFPAGAKTLASYGTVLDFTRYKVLRVLDLKECAELSAEHLKDLWDQVLMKYLSINSGSIGRITREIGHLKELETLDLSGSETVTVFKEVIMLPRLKHLFGKFQLSMRDSTTVAPVIRWVAYDLEKFLKDKSVLETLAGFVTGRRLGFPQLMSLMRRLRKVKIWCKSNASQKNLRAISGAITKFIHDETGQPDLNRSLSIDFQECSGEFLNTINTDAGKKGKLASLKLRGNLTGLPQFVGQLRAVEELCLWSTGLSWQDILDGLSMLGILKYLKLIEDNLGDIKIEPRHLKSIQRICVVCRTNQDITIQSNALLHLASLHIICKELLVIPGTTGIEIKHMAQLKEIGLHSQVQDTIKTTWQEAASRHVSQPIVLFIEDP